MPAKPVALVIEPNSKLTQPYNFLAEQLDIVRVESVEQAFHNLNQKNFDCFVVSTSFSVSKQLKLLESFKFHFHQRIIPLLLIVDLNQPISSVPGTHWADQIAILASNASRKLTLFTLEQLLSA